jgi:hypothetical protein
LILGFNGGRIPIQATETASTGSSQREIPDSRRGETNMGDKGKKDKGKREDQKKALLNPKEKRKAKKEKQSKA